MFQEARDTVSINEWTDRIYQNTAQEHIITACVSGRKMRLQKYNFPDTGRVCNIEDESSNNYMYFSCSCLESMD